MKISYNWLKDFVNIKLPPEKLAEQLTLRSFEVKKIEQYGAGLEKILVGEILKIRSHPKAKRLQLVKVNLGKKGNPEFVCGAFNIKVGQKVPVVLAGTALPNGTLVKERTILGIKSMGMLCSEKELGLAEDQTGIMILDPKLKVGQSLSKALGLPKVVFNLDILPNRAHDCLSHIGVAREVAAVTHEKFKIEKFKLKEKKGLKIEDFLKVKVQDKKLCLRYTARVITDVQVKESPWWLKKRLTSCGLRPINNIVDITNYVMLEYGQPLHAFDYDQLTGILAQTFRPNNQPKQIIIRKAREKEKIVTLDGKERELTKDMLVIADAKYPMAIAGVMGGLASEVKATTKTVVLESANFDPINIRQTSAKLGLRSESSDRFGYGLDPNLASQAQNRACYLIQKLASGKLVSKMIDIYPKKAKPKKIVLDLGWLKQFLGIEIPKNKIFSILKALGLKHKAYGLKLRITVPTFRLDLNIAEDIAEEIARIYGYDRIKEKSPKAKLKPISENKEIHLENKIKDILVGAGYTEIYNYSFLGADLLSKVGLKTLGCLSLMNPLSKDLAYLRGDLIPQILEKIAENLRHFSSFKIFELGKVYLPLEPQKLPCEAKMLCGAIVKSNLLLKAKAYQKSKLFYKTKGMVELLLDKLNIKDYVLRPLQSKEITRCWPYYHPARCAKIVKNSTLIGTVAEISPKTLSQFDIKAKVAVFSLSFDVLSRLASEEKTFKKIPKYPAVTLDLSFILAKKILHDHVKNAIFEVGKPLVREVKLFDIYKGKPLKENQKSLAFHIRFQAENRTLKDKEVKAIQNKIIRNLEMKFKAKIRKSNANAKISPKSTN